MDYSFLDSSEAVILSDENVRNENLKKSGNLVLTNKNIYFCVIGAFKGKIKNVQKYPINQIKVFQNKTQAKISNRDLMQYSLDIYFVSGNQSFSFINKIGKKRIMEWIKAIDAIVKGEEIPDDSTQYTGIPGVDVVASTLKDTFGAIAGGFKSGSGKEVSFRCESCGAPLSGTKGTIIQCPYCDTKQKI